MYFNENKFIIDNGRKASSSGLIGLLLGLIWSLIFSFSWLGTVFFTLFIGYIFLTGFWGGYRTNLWFRKYKYRMPSLLWQGLRVPVVTLGSILGILCWGFFEHFILLLGISTGYKAGPGMIAAQIILLPYIGKYYSKYIKFDDGY